MIYKKIFTSLILLLAMSFNLNATTNLLEPADGSNCVDVRHPVHFSWSYAGTEPVANYKLEIYEEGIQTPSKVYEIQLASTVLAYDKELLPARKYSWRIITNYVNTAITADTAISIFNTALEPDLLPNIETTAGTYCTSDGSCELTWEYDGQGYYKFEVVVSERSDFSTALFTITTETSSCRFIDLPVDENLYFRVRAVSSYANCVSQWSNVLNLVMINSPAIPLYSNFSIEDGNTCVSVTPMFRWTKPDGSKHKYVVDVSDSANFRTITRSFESYADSVQGFLSEFNHKYYWRVKAIDTSTQCESEYSEVREFTTRPEPVTLLTPPNNAKGSEALTSNNEIELSWNHDNPVANYTYLVQLSYTDEFNESDIILSEETSEMHYTFDLNIPDITNKSIFWRVKIIEGSCEAGWSLIWQFKTPYNTPKILYPTISETCFRNNAKEFKWEKSADALSYLIYFSTDSRFVKYDSVVVDKNIDSILVNIPNYETKYFWKIKALDSLNDSFWSEIAEFRTAVAPPSLLSPENKATSIPSDVEFKWSYRNNSEYNLQVSEVEDFSEILIDTVLQADHVTLILGANNKQYFWRVSVTDQSNTDCPSDFSAVYSFTTKLAAPTLISPIDNDTLKYTVANFKWENVVNATLYDFQIALDAEFTEEVETVIRVTQNEYRKTYLKEHTTYFWRVRATNKETLSEWSETFSFTTGLQLPDAPILIEPYNSMYRAPITLEFRWHKRAFATKYKLEYSKDLNFDENAVVIENLIDTSYKIETPLENYQTYYWRVCAINEKTIDEKTYEATSQWSSIWSFRTIKSIPEDKVELKAPANGTQNLVWDEIFLEWLPTENTEYYQLQVSTNNNFEKCAINVSKTVDTIYSTLRYLDTSKTYYWRVCPVNEGGAGEWSDVWTFSTSNVLSIFDITFIDELKISPVPAASTVSLNFTTLKHLENAEIIIVNEAGIRVKQIVGSYEGSTMINLDLTSYSNGTYFCYVNYNGKMIAATQFIVAK